MIKYILKRIVQVIPVLLGVSIIVFLMLSLSPGDPARLALGMNAKPEQIEACLLYTSPSPRDLSTSRMPSSA